MTLQSLIGTITTVLSFAAFLGVLWWALGRSRRERFADTNWDPPVTLGVRLVSVISDDLQHADLSAQGKAPT